MIYLPYAVSSSFYRDAHQIHLRRQFLWERETEANNAAWREGFEKLNLPLEKPERLVEGQIGGGSCEDARCCRSAQRVVCLKMSGRCLLLVRGSYRAH